MSPSFFYLLINEHLGSNMVLIRCIVLIISWTAPALTRTGLNLLVAVVTVLMVLVGLLRCIITMVRVTVSHWVAVDLMEK